MMPAACKDHGTPGNRKGYGVMRHRGKTELAHRVAYCEAHGLDIERIKGLVVRHACDNARCVERSHLRLGSQADNVRDMMERGRHRYTPLAPHVGTDNVNAKLDDEKVRSIRRAWKRGESQKSIAARLGVNASLISMVVNRKVWRHVA